MSHTEVNQFMALNTDHDRFVTPELKFIIQQLQIQTEELGRIKLRNLLNQSIT